LIDADECARRAQLARSDHALLIDYYRLKVLYSILALYDDAQDIIIYA
jgi:hypothetical protein